MKHSGWLLAFTGMLGVTVVALLMPADAVLQLKLWAVQQWPWALGLSGFDDASGADKWVHAGLFAALAMLGLLTWRQPFARAALFLGLLVLGALTEGAQHFVPGRSMSLGDWLADAAGVATGLALGLALLRLTRWQRQRH